MREKIIFEPGEAVQVVLDNDTGKPVDGRTGPQYMRVVDDDQRIIFAEPALEQAIRDSGAAAGDAIRIVKIGTGKKARWDVAIMGEPGLVQAPAARQLPAAAPPPVSQPAAARPMKQPEAITPALVDLVDALRAAIDAAIEAERYAAMQAHPLTFTSEDIRTMANSILCRKAGR